MTTNNGEARKVVLKLQRQQQRALEDYILASWKDIEANRPTAQMLAQAASQHLKFKITKYHIAGALRTLDKHYNPKKGSSGKDHNTSRNRLRGMVIIGDAVVSLYKKLDEAVPKALETWLREAVAASQPNAE